MFSKYFKQLQEDAKDAYMEKKYNLYKKPLQRDMEELKNDGWNLKVYPPILIAIYLPGLFLLTRRIKMPSIFKNPLKRASEAQTHKIGLVKGKMLITFALLGSVGLYSMFYLKEYGTTLMLYIKYKPMVDRYVVLRDEKALQGIIRGNREGVSEGEDGIESG